MPNLFCNYQIERNCHSYCNTGYQATQGYGNSMNYQNNYQNSYASSSGAINNPSSKYDYPDLEPINQPVNLYQTTPAINPNYKSDFDVGVIKSQKSKFNLGSKHLTDELSSPKSITNTKSSIVSDINNNSEVKNEKIIKNYTFINEVKTPSTTPTYIRTTESIYKPSFNFPLQFATTATTTKTELVKINLKKQTDNKINNNTSFIKKNEEVSNIVEYENNNSYNLQPKVSEVYKPIVQSLYASNNLTKNNEIKKNEETTEDDGIKIAGLNYFKDPINTSISNSIYDEVVPFDEEIGNIEKIEVVPSSISDFKSNNKLPDIDNTLEYDEDSHLNSRPKAKASKQYISDDPITNEIITNDLIKIPLKSTYERCNDKNLLRIMKKNMLTSPVISKQIIFGAWKNEYNEHLDVICSKIPFSYTVISSPVYCEVQTLPISCFAYIQPINRKD
uniref:Ground-like domain-containing protein n=1 Tax=Strongyloides stercoralis TaxID=6248 RepID=A0A0K0EMD5_STRER